MKEVKTATAIEPIILTDGAVSELVKIREQESIPNEYALRIGVKGGGCSGFSYILGFDEMKENDKKYTVNGMEVIIDKAHSIYLLGMEIDFENGLNNRGFSFNNPNASDTCGCGTSFAT